MSHAGRFAKVIILDENWTFQQNQYDSKSQPVVFE